MGFEKDQNVIVSKFSNRAYFKNRLGRLCVAPLNEDGKTIDITEASLVDYFFLTSEEWEEAFHILNILEEQDEVR